MKISEFMSPPKRFGKGSGRLATSYRSQRRNVARLKYRLAKKEAKHA